MEKAIVIGASSGIGMSLAGILVDRGYRVAVTGRRLERLETLRDRYPDRIIPKRMDVQDIGSLEAACDALTEELGGFDLLVISAGIGIPNKGLEFHKEQSVVRTNVEGFTCLADWAMRTFKARGHGHLVNISSIASLRGAGIAPSYNASKAFQANYLEGLRINAQMARLPIHVTDIRPGFVDTDMTRGQRMFWLASPDKAARQIFQAISKKKKVVYVTRRWVVVAWLLKVMPYRIYSRLT